MFDLVKKYKIQLNWNEIKFHFKYALTRNFMVTLDVKWSISQSIWTLEKIQSICWLWSSLYIFIGFAKLEKRKKKIRQHSRQSVKCYMWIFYCRPFFLVQFVFFSSVDTLEKLLYIGVCLANKIRNLFKSCKTRWCLLDDAPKLQCLACIYTLQSQPLNQQKGQ